MAATVKPRLDAGDYPRALFNPSAGDDPVRGAKYRANNVFAVDADLRLRNVDKYLLPSRDLRLYGEFGWDDTCCNSNFVPKRATASGLVGTQLIGLFGMDGFDGRFEWVRTSSLSFTHHQFYRGYWTRGSVISDFVGTETDGEDYFARVTQRFRPGLMVGAQFDRAVIGNTVHGFTGAFRGDDNGFDHLLLLELTRSFR